MKDELRPAALSRGVVIVGANSLQNKLLARLIGERTGRACNIRPADPLNAFPASSLLALLDAAEYASRLPALCASGTFSSIAVMNADESLPFDEIVSCPGVKGVFFRDTSEDNLVKGIEAIFRGEYWLPRRILCAHLERTRSLPKATLEATRLTRKETETLCLLAGGNSTEHIAHRLNVSRHTVKTHIYNLFRKLHVSNRVQAVHWALHHIDGLERGSR